MLSEELAALNHQNASSAIAGERNGAIAAGGFDTVSGSAACGVDQAKALEEGRMATAAAAATPPAGKDAASSNTADVATTGAAAPAGRRPALLERLFSRQTSLPEPTVAVADSSTTKDLDQDVQLPLRRSPSGTMQLNPLDPAVAVKPQLTVCELLLRTLPIWLTVLVLLLTRIPAIPIKKVLQR
jgi:hypothetical protein